MPKKIMIVDDDKEFLIEITELLEEAGYLVVSVSDSLLAENLAVKQKPDLILMDLRMPSMCGFEVAVNLKKNKDISEIPVIAITGYAPVEEYEFVNKVSSIVKCLKKPLKPLDVIKEIEWTLSAK